MNKRLIFKFLFGLFIVFVLAGCSHAINSENNQTVTGNRADVMTDDDQMMENDDAMMEDDDQMMENDDAMMEDDDQMMDENSMSKSGQYIKYSDDKVSLAANNDVVLFFYASWCPTCRALENDINDNLDNIPADLIILKTDYDTYTELKRKYGVTYQHTFVQVDSDGNMIKKWSGSSTLSKLVEEIK